MNWEVIGTVAQVVAAVAVVVTLFYLASQLRSSVRQSQREAIRHTWDSLNALVDRFSESVETASIINRGRVDRHSLDENEWLIFFFIHVRLLNTLESWHLLLEDVQDRRFVAQQHENIEALVQYLLTFSSTRELYAEVRHTCAPGIRNLIDKTLSEASAK